MQEPRNISSFFLAGINYKKSDALIRGQFSITEDQYANLLSSASSFGITELLVLSTCNRTEIYAFAENKDIPAKLLCSQTSGSLENFNALAYCKNGIDAIAHFFDVAAGLDSQILGDYEITGQIKAAAKFSKQRNFIGAYLERLINEVLQSSKKIRTNTQLSDGTVSVSFAAVQYIKKNYPDISNKKILLLGTGKIGNNTCKNLASYLPGTAVMLVNRSFEKAKLLAEKFNFSWEHMENIDKCVHHADIILVATNSREPVISKKHLHNAVTSLIIDLSVPCNVDDDVKQLKNIQLVNVDELSKIKDETLLKRCAEIPKAKLIIQEHINNYLEWHSMRRNVPALKAVKDKLLTIQAAKDFNSFLPMPTATVCSDIHESKIQKVIGDMAVKMRTQHSPGCIFIEAINDFISPASN